MFFLCYFAYCDYCNHPFGLYINKVYQSAASVLPLCGYFSVYLVDSLHNFLATSPGFPFQFFHACNLPSIYAFAPRSMEFLLSLPPHTSNQTSINAFAPMSMDFPPLPNKIRQYTRKNNFDTNLLGIQPKYLKTQRTNKNTKR